MLVSNPLCEKMQTSAVAVPLLGRCSEIALPPRVHVLLLVTNGPNAATFKSRSLAGTETPAVVGSTTTMSFPVAAGNVLLRAITSSETFGAATISDTAFDFVPLGFRICTDKLPGTATSAAVTGVVHSRADVHFVIRELPPISIVHPGPGFEAVKPLPSTRSVKPWAAPAYTLDGCTLRMFAPVEIVTLAMPDCEASSPLMATTDRKSVV